MDSFRKKADNILKQLVSYELGQSLSNLKQVDRNAIKRSLDQLTQAHQEAVKEEKAELLDSVLTMMERLSVATPHDIAMIRKGLEGAGIKE